jgi:hypothetical protein
MASTLPFYVDQKLTTPSQPSVVSSFVDGEGRHVARLTDAQMTTELFHEETWYTLEVSIAEEVLRLNILGSIR